MMKWIFTVVFVAILGFNLVAQEQDKTDKAETEQTENNGWTPFRFSCVNVAAFPAAAVPVYGMELDIVQGDNDFTGGYSLGIFSSSDTFKGLYTGFVHRAKTSQGFMIGGAVNLADVSHGWDIGGINFCHDYQAGIQTAAVFNYADSGQDGVRLAGLGNVTKSGFQDGVQIAGILNQAKTAQGVQFAGIANLEDQMQGWQLACVNVVGFKRRKLSKTSSCCQTGVVNWMKKPKAAKTVEQEERDWALQLGVVNYTEGASGIQFGLININKNGFLPFFPLINFNF